MKPALAVVEALVSLTVIPSTMPARASDLIYQPINPSFGGNPFNSSHLLALANA